MDGASMFNTRTARGRLLLLDPARGGGEVDGDPTTQRRGGGSSGIPTGLRQALREEEGVSWEGEGGARA